MAAACALLALGCGDDETEEEKRACDNAVEIANNKADECGLTNGGEGAECDPAISEAEYDCIGACLDNASCDVFTGSGDPTDLLACYADCEE